ncbi:histone-like nucleoid-structuring protein Lsr2 [Catellatospora sp. NPDC049133]|uniref:Lsr2 family DNA-binding protein n=1 Tax=Catellatospora sp. NPDC049133 TaxID=3155499 RepID=UPI0033F6B145
MARHDEDTWGRGFPTAQPRLPADGIRARSRRGDIATTWWSRRFLKAIESPETASRLSRGRSYARSGQVLAMTIAPGEVAAQVQGSRREPYTVTVATPPFTSADWRRAVGALAERAGYTAELLDGRMPEDVEQVLEPLGLALFPAMRQLDLECSCPDWGNPCKHAAAVCYLLAELFDEDPFVILHWRGMPRDELLDALRAHRARQAGGAPDDDGEPDELRGFWSGGPLPEPPPADPAAATRLLQRLGQVGLTVVGMDFAQALAPAYDAMVRHRWSSPLLADDLADAVPPHPPVAPPAAAPPERPTLPSATEARAASPGAVKERMARPGAAEVRAWARGNGISVNERGRIRAEVVRAYLDAHRRG